MTPQEHGYTKILDRIAAAAHELEDCAPAMAALAGQYSEVATFSFATNPNLAHAGIIDRKAEVEMAAAVIGFVKAWQTLRNTTEAKLMAKVEVLMAAAKEDE